MAETGAANDLSPAGAVGITPGRRLLNIVGGSGGNLIEWFDWFAYSAFTIYFASVFFPKGDQSTQFLQAALVFGVGFVARPAGAWLMGVYADRKGRKAALTLSVSMMCLGSLIIGLAPGYAVIGVAAPALLVIARIVQGLSLGGEYGASVTYVAEMSSGRYRGFWSGFLYVTLVMGQLLAISLLLLLQTVMTPEDLQAWGWRIPFFIGAALAVLVFWMRRGMHETAAYASVATVKERGKTMLLFTKYPKETLIIVALTAASGSFFYVFTTYMQKFLINSASGPAGDGFSRDDASRIMMVVLVVFMIIHPFAGWMSDRLGRRPMLIASFGLCALSAYPAYLGVMQATTNLEAIAICLLPLFALSGMTAISGLIKAELFPAHVRALGVALPYALTQAVFAGNAEAAALWFKQQGNEPGFFIFLTVVQAVAFIVAIAMRDTGKHTLIVED